MTTWNKVALLSDQWSSGSATSGTWRPGSQLSTQWYVPVFALVEGIQGDDLVFLTGDDGEILTFD